MNLKTWLMVSWHLMLETFQNVQSATAIVITTSAIILLISLNTQLREITQNYTLSHFLILLFKIIHFKLSRHFKRWKSLLSYFCLFHFNLSFFILDHLSFPLYHLTILRCFCQIANDREKSNPKHINFASFIYSIKAILVTLWLFLE